MTQGPTTLPSPGGFLTSFRARTLSSTVWRQLLMAPGDTVDSLLVAESLRRLRGARIFDDVSISARRCGGDADSADVTVTTRDAWTLLPTARVTPPSAIAIGLEDRDILGTGRTLALTEQRSRLRSGASFLAIDPWLLGSDAMAAVRVSRFGETHLFRASIRNHENSIYEPWRAEAWVGRQSFSARIGPQQAIHSGFASFLVGHITAASPTFVRKFLIGADLDSAAILVFRGVLSPPEARSRRFLGASLDVLQQTARFDTVSWIVPGRGFIDTPVGTEGEGLVSLGHDDAAGENVARYDFWTGRIFLPARGRVVSADAWTSGYAGRVRSNHIDRLSVSAWAQAQNGFWGAKLLVEQLLQLDPDLRTLSVMTESADPTFAAVPVPFRLSDRAVASTVERSWHLRPIGLRSMLDGALFGGGSVRWDPPERGMGAFAVAVVGLRLRLLSANGTIGSTRLDLGYPIASNVQLRHRLLVSIALGPLFDINRQRDGRRRQQ